MAQNFEEVAKQFVQFYYDKFDTDRSQLANLYRPNSMMTFESAPLGGADAIVEKLTTLPFSLIKHKVDTLDAQPSNEQGGVLVLVTGALLVEAEQRPMSYTQVFHLMPDGGSYFIFNDIFKLVYPAS